METISQAVALLAHERPLLMIVEDLHWAGAATIALLEYLARAAADLRVFIVGTYREEETLRDHPLRAMRRRLVQERLLSHLALSPLDFSSVETIVERVVGRCGPSVVEGLHRHSDGNPFFLGEILRETTDLAALQEARTVPSSIEAMVARRLDRLRDGSRLLAQLGAVAGTTFDVEVLRDASGWSESALLDGLGELVEHRIVRAAAAPGGETYAFSHHLMHAAIYAGVPPATLRRSHRRIAQVLEAAYEGSRADFAARLATHFELGGEPERAAEYFRQAGSAALAVYANDEAEAYAARGLALAPAPAVAARLLLVREAVADRCGDRDAQRAALGELTALAGGAADAELACEVLHRRVRLAAVSGERRAEAQLIDELERTAAHSARWQPAAWTARAAFALHAAEFGAASAALERALEAYERLGDAEAQVESYAMLCEIARKTSGDSQKLLGRARSVAAATQQQGLVLRVMHAQCGDDLTNEQFSRARERAANMLALAEAVGDRVLEAFAHRNLGAALLCLFEIEPARRHQALATALFARFGRPSDCVTGLIWDGLFAQRVGAYDAATAALSSALERARSIDFRSGELSALTCLAHTLAFAGDYPAAEALAAENLDFARRLEARDAEWSLSSSLAAAEAGLGKFDSAVERLERCVAADRARRRPMSLADDLTALAATHVAAGRPRSAAPLVAQLVALVDERGAELHEPQHMLWTAARAASALGDEAQARAWRERAVCLFAERLARIPDEESRACFRAVPANRAIATANARAAPAPVPAPRPRNGASRLRPAEFAR